MKFFVDENLDGPAFVDPLRAAGLDVTRHRDRFAQGVPDTEWLPIVAARGLIVLTSDGRMQFRPVEVEAIIGNRARVLFLRKGKNATHPRLAALLVRSHQVVAGFFEGCSSLCVAVLASRPDSDDPDESKPGRISVPSAFARRASVAKRSHRP